MVNLLEDYLEFIVVFIDDYCGFFIIREGKKEMKGYRVVFISLVLRIVYYNIFSKFEIDVFINVFYYFICQRGQI